MSEPELLTVKEVCQLAGIGRTTLDRLRSEGKGPRRVVGLGERVLRFKRSVVLRWIEGLRETADLLPPPPCSSGG